MAEDPAAFGKDKLELEAKKAELEAKKALELKAKLALEPKTTRASELKYGKDEVFQKEDDGDEDRKLQLEWHQLKRNQLPENIGRLAALHRVEWVDQQLTYLPEDIGRVSQLRHLDVTCNKLTVLPASVCSLILLENLCLSENQLVSLPESLGKLEKLQRLDVYNNKLTVLPESLVHLVSLQDLDVSFNVLASLPEEIGNLTLLEKLRATDNCLTLLPASLCKLVRLKHLSVSHNELILLPESLGNLVQLQYLHLSLNKLTSLPKSIYFLTTLKTLDLSHNQLTSIPDSVGDLPALTWLNVCNNSIGSFPSKMSHLTFLDTTNQVPKDKHGGMLQTMTTEWEAGKSSYLEMRLNKLTSFEGGHADVDVVIDKLLKKEVLTPSEKEKLEAGDKYQRVVDLMSNLKIKDDVDVDKFFNVLMEESSKQTGHGVVTSIASSSTCVEVSTLEGNIDEPVRCSEGKPVASEKDTCGVGCTKEEAEQLVKMFETLRESGDVGRTYGTDVFAIGDFDERGGFLVLRKLSAHMEIPRGALKSRQTVYFYAASNTSDQGLSASFSLAYKCGPDGATFDVPVLLHIPHSLRGPVSNLVKVLTREKGSLEWVVSADTKVSFVDDRATLELPHFSWNMVGVLKQLAIDRFKSLFFERKPMYKEVRLSFSVKSRRVVTFHLMEPSVYEAFKDKQKGRLVESWQYLFCESKGCLIVAESEKKNTNRAAFDSESVMRLSAQMSDLQLADGRESTLFHITQEHEEVKLIQIAISADAAAVQQLQTPSELSLQPINNEPDTTAHADETNFFRWQFKTSFNVPLMRALIEAEKSVCLIRSYDHSIHGTGFRIGSRHILTAWHVVEGILTKGNITTPTNPSLLHEADVIFDYSCDPPTTLDMTFKLTSNYKRVDDLDAAILEVMPTSVNGASGLPPNLATDPNHREDLEVYIIGHVTSNDRGQSKQLEKPCNVHHFTSLEKHRLSEDARYKDMLGEEFLVYNCTQEHGASGGPVLSLKRGALTVVAMHVRGFPTGRYPSLRLVHPQIPWYEAGVRISAIHCKLQSDATYENSHILLERT